jgi:predicted DNA-binding WGR domain protein
MSAPPDSSILLYRIDESRNMRRFYVMATMPTLFGETSLLRNWGRIGKQGQMRIETFATSADAGEALDRLARKKGRRGYRRPSRV